VSDVVSLVTGAASGVGLACGRRLVERGDRVVCVDLSPDTPRFAAEIGAALGLVADVGSSAECDAAVTAAVEQVGHVDHLVAAAGMIELTGAAHETDDDTWHRMQQVNVDGCFFMARAVGRHLIGRGAGGSIVLLGSINSQIAMPGQVAYVA
jgi:NAD(P)-dependent dehydrogenase (short-subunit alcohol dehydrogenase family)